MRKHDVRKWLHAILDLLPVILIPVFMIYSHRHTINSYKVEYDQNKVVDFNQLVDINIPSLPNITSSFNNGLLTINYENNNASEYYFKISNNVNFVSGHEYYFRYKPVDSLEGLGSSLQIYLNLPNDNYPYLNEYTSYLVRTLNTNGNRPIEVQLPPSSNSSFSVYLQLYDLTQMGLTYDEFNTYYTNDYYEYTLSHKELLNVGSITYNDTDIGSQFMYCLYNSVDKYFNLSSVFNFQNVYDWFILNIFGGNAPLIVPIVWNIILYEFIMDILFITYAVFMFIIDFTEHFMDSCFARSYRGGTRK